MRVREQLVKANRLEQVVNKLSVIASSEDYDFPVSLFMDTDNIAKSRVSGIKVRNQAKILLEQIENDDINAVYVQNFQNMNNELFDIVIFKFCCRSSVPPFAIGSIIINILGKKSTIL